MGSQHAKIDMAKTKTKDAGPALDALNIKKYTKIGVIGRGGFGKVWKVENKKDKKMYALKQMSKASLVQEKC